MFHYELDAFLKKKLKNKNVRVVPSDMLPAKFSLPAGFIVNLSPSNHQGSHWIAIFINESGATTYFCSYGMKPEVRSIQHFLRLHSKTIQYNDRQLQAMQSTYCGEYAAMFLLNSFSGVRLSDFLKKFSMNLILNDMLITKMFNRAKNFSH